MSISSGSLKSRCYWSMLIPGYRLGRPEAMIPAQQPRGDLICDTSITLRRKRGGLALASIISVTYEPAHASEFDKDESPEILLLYEDVHSLAPQIKGALSVPAYEHFCDPTPTQMLPYHRSIRISQCWFRLLKHITPRIPMLPHISTDIPERVRLHNFDESGHNAVKYGHSLHSSLPSWMCLVIDMGNP
ncbi:hypothetical protein BJ508DRAFT_305582 [Ascobolus immersus RN42]|uniref:Uncharacterized protein n=1 Tax=Ascobolus immersus RN42 TaxID=1160509 RepID=A0A3N4ILE8_ASCIM|nr:hypothetical protein BJ508DRAFT_305582 [Ascobolus immersus RN42]